MRHWLLLSLAACGLVDFSPVLARDIRVRPRGVAVTIPLPQPRPANLTPEPSRTPAGSNAVANPGLSECRKTFATRGGVALPAALPAPDAACAVDDPVTFRVLAMPDGSKVELDAAITTGCAFANEMLEWVRIDLPAVLPEGQRALKRLTGVGGQACRPRNGVPGGFLSEHATGNALDLGGIILQDGRSINLTASDAATRPFREAVQASACKRFMTVLGPGSDSAHRDHIHLDMRKRARDYRICQWTLD